MYLPYLRGKQFELIALRELSALMSENGSIHPIIEPVKSSYSTLRITCDQLVEQNIPFTLIINPRVGELVNTTESIVEFINENLNEFEGLHIGIIIDSNLDTNLMNELVDHIDQSRRFTFIHLSRFSDTDLLAQFYQNKDVRYNLFADISLMRRYRRIIGADTRVTLNDPFISQPTNAEYANNVDEFFSDEHNFYLEDGFIGFSDYLTIGENYSDSGFAPYAVTIHLTYERQDGQIWIRHFVSDSNDDYDDVPGTYREALLKLIEFIDGNGLTSLACQEFRRQNLTGQFPGLGSVKKLSIIHHIQLIISIFERR